MALEDCPRCGMKVVQLPGRGRPRKWCSDECRRLASEERRAARRTGQPVEIREQIRERIIERSRPISNDGAVERVLADTAATEKLLRVLAYRMRNDPPVTDSDRRRHLQIKPAVLDLYHAHHDSDFTIKPTSSVSATPSMSPRNKAAAHRQAVALVLESPRSTREILSQLTDRARSGSLGAPEHSGTLLAAESLLYALIDARLLRRRR